MINRWDSAAIVPKTSELLPEPETPVNTVNRRLGISTLTSERLFTRAPITRIRSWLSAACTVMSAASRECRAVNAGQLGSWLMRIMLPVGSRKAQSRTPQGWSIGSWTTSAPLACSRSNVPSRSSVAKVTEV